MSTELSFHTEHDGGTCTLSVEGEVDIYTAPRLKEEIVSLIESGCIHMIVDLSGVTFIDSSGLGVLVSARGRIAAKDGAIRIVCTRDNVLKLLRITGLDRVFPIYADPAKAADF